MGGDLDAPTARLIAAPPPARMAKATKDGSSSSSSGSEQRQQQQQQQAVAELAAPSPPGTAEARLEDAQVERVVLVGGRGRDGDVSAARAGVVDERGVVHAVAGGGGRVEGVGGEGWGTEGGLG
jgi:hypothetical protein